MDDRASPREIDLFRMTLALASALLNVETALLEIIKAMPSDTDMSGTKKAYDEVRASVQEYMKQMREFQIGS